MRICNYGSFIHWADVYVSKWLQLVCSVISILSLGMFNFYWDLDWMARRVIAERERRKTLVERDPTS